MTAKKKRAKGAHARPAGSPVHRFPCLAFEQHGVDLVLFAAPANILWQILEINQRTEDKDDGYQRVLSPSRVNRIASFVDSKKTLPTSLLVSLVGDATLSVDRKELSIPRRPDAGWIIDGQHRLAGAHKATNEIILPVVAFLGLDLKGQIEQFVTVNREQKGVPSSLYLELLSSLNIKNELEAVKERTADLGILLHKDEASPFYGRIARINAPKPGQVSLTNFVRRVSPHLQPNRGRLALGTIPDETRAKALNNYFKALQIVFPKEYQRKESIFFRTLGFGAILAVLPTIVDLALQRGDHAFTTANVADTLQLISHYDFAAWHQLGTGAAAENQAAADLRAELGQATKTTDGHSLLRVD